MDIWIYSIGKKGKYIYIIYIFCTNLSLNIFRLGHKSVTWELLQPNLSHSEKSSGRSKGTRFLGLGYGVKTSFWGVSAGSSGPSAFSHPQSKPQSLSQQAEQRTGKDKEPLLAVSPGMMTAPRQKYLELSRMCEDWTEKER